MNFNLKIFIMKKITLLALLIFSFSANSFEQVKKSQSSKPKIVRDGSVLEKAIIVQPNQLEDNADKYVGKWIVTELKYYDSDNGGYSLRNVDDYRVEKMMTINQGIYDDDENLHTRVMRINGVTKIIVRIQKEDHKEFPNAIYGYFGVAGYLSKYNTLVANRCIRM